MNANEEGMLRISFLEDLEELRARIIKEYRFHLSRQWPFLVK